MKKTALVFALLLSVTSQAHASEFLTRLAVTAVVTVAAFAIDGTVGLVKDAVAGVSDMVVGKDGTAIPPAQDRPDPQPTPKKEEEKQ